MGWMSGRLAKVAARTFFSGPLAMNEVIAQIEREVAGITIESKQDVVILPYDRILFFLSELKRIKALCELQMLVWIKANGAIEVSDEVRYYAGSEKITKCLDVPGTVEAVMAATGGDFTRFCDVLASNAIKYGAAKNVLSPEEYARLFKTEWKDTLEKKLMKSDDKFKKLTLQNGSEKGKPS